MKQNGIDKYEMEYEESENIHEGQVNKITNTTIGKRHVG